MVTAPTTMVVTNIPAPKVYRGCVWNGNVNVVSYVRTCTSRFLSLEGKVSLHMNVTEEWQVYNG